MFKISRLADYAAVILSAFPQEGSTENDLLSAAYIADKTMLPEPTVAKVLKALCRNGILDSVRGTGGGYKLKRALGEISVADVIIAIEGPVAIAACVTGANDTCDFSAKCTINGRWDGVNAAVRTALENVSIMDIVAPVNNGALRGVKTATTEEVKEAHGSY